MSRLIILCLLGCVTTVLGRHSGEDRIIGGQTARQGQFPYQVALRTLMNRHFCGGTILSEWWVLSAAHCTADEFDHPDTFVVVVGAHSITDGLPHYVEHVINHPDWDLQGIQNDICMIRVEDPIEFNRYVQPARLPSGDIPAGRLPAVVSGWGLVRVSIVW